MKANIFRFKQFQVDQTGCAMKINTDGVLLAAMAESESPKTILDVGTGTGVIALMLAQRFVNATIDAVEIDPTAAATAKKNFENSPFFDRLRSFNVAIEQFGTDQRYDLIVSNPPFFVNDLKNAEEKKGMARHTNNAFFEALITKVAALLKDDGSFWFILPIKQGELLVELAESWQLTITNVVYLHSDENKDVFRMIGCLTRKNIELVKRRFNIYQAEKVYTDEYMVLLKDFFLGY